MQISWKGYFFVVLCNPCVLARPGKGCALVGRSTAAVCVLQPFLDGGRLRSSRHSMPPISQGDEPANEMRTSDAADERVLMVAEARHPTQFASVRRREGPVLRGPARRGVERTPTTSTPSSRRTTHHHHKYLPNPPRQSRQEQAPRRPTRPRPRASPTRRRRTPPPRQSPRRPRPPRAPARGAPRPARRWPRVFRPRS